MFKSGFDIAFASGRTVVSKKHKFYVNLTPKVMSSSLICSVLRDDYPDKYKEINTHVPGEVHKYDGLILIKNTEMVNPHYKRFAIVRNPLLRTVSSFYSKFVFDLEFSEIIYKPICDFKGLDVFDMTFHAFVDYLLSIPDLWLDPHFKSQSCFLIFKKYDFIFEANESGIAEFYKASNLQPMRINCIDNNYRPIQSCCYDNIDCSKITVRELCQKVKNNHNLPTYDQMLSKDIVADLKDRYSCDFNLKEFS